MEIAEQEREVHRRSLDYHGDHIIHGQSSGRRRSSPGSIGRRGSVGEQHEKMNRVGEMHEKGKENR